MNNLSIVVPIYNEEQILEKEIRDMIASLSKVLPDVYYEIVLVENGSKDKTREIAQNLTQEFSQVKVVLLPFASYGGAVKTGFLSSKEECIALLNIDFWDINFVKKALDIFEKENSSIVLGSKTMNKTDDKRSALRRNITRILNFILRIVFGFKGTDTHGMKVISKSRIVPIVQQCITDRELFDTELILRSQYAGFETKEISVICEEKRPSTLGAGNFFGFLRLVKRTIKDLARLFFVLRIKRHKNNKAREFIKNYQTSIGLFFVILFMCAFSLQNLTTKPAIWYDEGINIELARNFSEFGKLDLIVAPLEFSGRGANIGSTGYIVTAPLAGFFKIFGFGFEQARIYMLLWMIGFIICLFYFVKKRFGGTNALLTVLLVATFASFYGNGRSVMGEIPGFTLILLSFIWYFDKRNVFVSGIFLGLSVISKPSVFVFFIPAFVLLFLFEKKDVIKRTIKLGLGSAIALFAWIAIYMSTALSSSTWSQLKKHFSNPYQEEGLNSFINAKNNLVSFFNSPTLIYFSLFVVIIFVSLCLNKEYYKKNRSLILLCGFYSIFAFFYFLKGLGYFRYLIAVQILIFILLVPSVKVIVHNFFRERYVRLVIVACFSFLIIFQASYLFTKAKLFYSDSPQKIFDYIQENYNNPSIGLINVPAVSALVSPEKKFQTLSTYGMRDLGENPLDLPENILPEVLVLDPLYELDDNQVSMLEIKYVQDKIIDGDFIVFSRQ